jgi:endonuclease I
MKTNLKICLCLFLVSLASCQNSSSIASVSEPESSIVQGEGAQFPSDFTEEQKAYYQGVEGLKGRALFSKLKEIVNKGFTSKTYGDAREGLKDIDEDLKDSSKVVEIYTQRSVLKTDSMFGNNAGLWNREHCYPQMRMGVDVNNSSTGSGADLHAIHASDGNVNGIRSNLNYYQFTGSEKYTTDIATKDGYKDKAKYNSSLGFEPIDIAKGDCARSAFYMAVKWDNCSITNTTSQTTTSEMGSLKWLLKWNEQDFVTDFEETRNEKVFTKYQHNRNPFIDCSNWVNLIWNESGIIE